MDEDDLLERGAGSGMVVRAEVEQDRELAQKSSKLQVAARKLILKTKQLLRKMSKTAVAVRRRQPVRLYLMLTAGMVVDLRTHLGIHRWNFAHRRQYRRLRLG